MPVARMEFVAVSDVKASPSLVFIYTDEQAFNTLLAYGNSAIEMPNLNRLATVSHVFERAYVTQPVCTPSRSSLLTGLYPHTNGCTENNVALGSDIPCVPEMIGGDYATAHFGKWHLGDEVFAQHGFDQWASVEDEYQKYFSPGRDKGARSSYHHALIDAGLRPENGMGFTRKEAARLPEKHGKAAYVADLACRFIRQNSDRPFILYANFFEPHMPFFGPRDNQYDPATVPLPASFDAVPDEGAPLKAKIMAEQFLRQGHSGLDLKTEQDWRRMIANYWGLCSLIDTHVGRILDTLQDVGSFDRTLIVFTSDHGDMMGAHRLLTKCFMYEEAARVPLLIKLPGQSQTRRVAGAYSQIDVVPTILDYMGTAIPENLQGVSLRQDMEAPDGTLPSRDVFMEWNGGNNGLGDVIGQVSKRDWMLEAYDAHTIDDAMRDPVRTVYTQSGWKLNFSPLGEHELYNLLDDPHELHNVFTTTDETTKADLISRIQGWQDRTGDTVPVGRT